MVSGIFENMSYYVVLLNLIISLMNSHKVVYFMEWSPRLIVLLWLEVDFLFYPKEVFQQF